MPTRIEVHFDTPSGRRRAIVLPGTVDAIILDVAKTKANLRTAQVRNEQPPADKVPVEGQIMPLTDDSNAGPGVCYLIDDQLHCW